MAEQTADSEPKEASEKSSGKPADSSAWQDELRRSSADEKAAEGQEKSIASPNAFVSGAVNEVWAEGALKGSAQSILRKQSDRWEEMLSAGPVDGSHGKHDKNERLMLDGFYLLDNSAIATQRTLDRAHEIKTLTERAKFTEIPEIRDLAKLVEIGKDIIKQLNPSGMALTKEQLAQALQDPSFKGEKAQVLAAMYHGFDKIRNISNHEWFFQSKRIAASDLDLLPSLPKKHQEFVDRIVDASIWSDKNFSAYAGSDGLLRASKLTEALNSPTLRDMDKQPLKTISELLEKHPGGVDAKRLDELFRIASVDTPEARLLNTVYDAVRRTAVARNESKGESRLYPSFPRGINPDAVKQGVIGDCYFIAALSAVAKSDPDTIRKSIQDNNNGTYTVTFKGAPDRPITVKAPTEAEMGLYNSGRDNGVWATVMEKAYGKMRNSDRWFGAYTPQDALDGGGYTGEALKLVSGEKVYSLAASSNEEALSQSFDLAFRGGTKFTSVTAVSLAAEAAGAPGRTKDGFVRGHAYTVVGFDRDDKGNGSLVLQNPWAGKNGTPDGRFKVPLVKAIRNFHIFDFTAGN